jgi:catechol 2,3-dioxygenase-like lactoylglutathione lyase family enzyme
MSDAPSLFRVILQVSDLDRARGFYARLLGTEGRRIVGSRHYFDCGPVILALLQAEDAAPLPDYVYFAVPDLGALHARARGLACLESGDVHGDPAGEIAQRPWGERSFYARDPFGNGLCFVDAKTVFTGR